MWKMKIGENAGVIWQSLDSKGEQNISVLKRNTRLDDKNLYLALGWLAKENKIFFTQKRKQIMIGLI